MPDIMAQRDLSPEFEALRGTILLDNGLPDLAASLIEAYRAGKGRPWRIKFAYDTAPPLSMDRAQAARMGERLREIGEVEMADGIDYAVKRALRYDDIY